jgi:hypothetical protein
MKVHGKNKNPILLFLVLLIIAILFLPFKSYNQKNIFWDYYEKISTYDIGASSIHELFEGSIKNPRNFLKFIKKAPKALKNAVLGVERDEDLPILSIDIKFKNYKKLLEDRDSALLNGIGYNYRKVKAEITFNNKKINSKIRLKGHLSDHWRSKHRMSFRVELKGDNSILGFKEFSLHKPSARQHPYDQSFQDLQRDISNISPKHNYVKLYVNGEDWGVMNIEEHLTKELLEKQKFKESIIVEFGNEKHDIYKRTVNEIYEDYKVSDPYINVNILDEKKYLNQNIFRKYYSYISQESILKNSEIYDNDSFTKSLILSLIWNNTHSLFNQNSRYYFNPYNLKLIPITTDQSFFSEINEKIQLPAPYERVILTKSFEERFDKNLQIVNKSLFKLPKIINKWQKYFPLDPLIDTDIIFDNHKLINKDFKDVIKQEVSNNNLKVNQINEIQSLNLLDHIHAKHFENGEIHIFNLTREDLLIKAIKSDSMNLQIENNLIIKGKAHSNYVPHIIKTNLKGIFDNKIEITTKLVNGKLIQNHQRKHLLGYTILVENLKNPLKGKTNLDKYDFFQKIDEENYFIKKGKWVVDQPITIKKNLTIQKGTELLFKEGAYLIINGKLSIQGTEKEKVILRALNKNWKGIYVYESIGKSIINHCTISDVTFLRDGILELTGGINFYKANVDILNTSFTNTSAEDFLNIVHSDFFISNTKFINASSDAFDSDFSEGKIENSFFNHISGDGVDFSGSKVSLIDNNFKNIRDKAISAGEKSNLKVKNIIVDSVGVGISSKDASIVSLENSKFSNYKLYALMTYQKKSFYGAPTLTGNNISFDNIDLSCLRQINSNMIVNKITIESSNIDVDNLYQSEIMKK